MIIWLCKLVNFLSNQRVPELNSRTALALKQPRFYVTCQVQHPHGDLFHNPFVSTLFPMIMKGPENFHESNGFGQITCAYPPLPPVLPLFPRLKKGR